ncbi:hypothetical protein FO440_22205 [Mucilaginibacter corticis]|uniref:Uncharacterized protein n=1 Tax=Mucilaginibacter corticis TaxID=2597670 RepID=A0A556M9M2_9SPHI|nr:hypothetical protein [Mucilaginibacter corticis]TSJ36546.1 hypothetical protein FO440_22205 [Mucilaginibacter corticis]
MEMILTPEFNDLFPGENDTLEELLKDIPSLLVVQFLAMANAELYYHRSNEGPAQYKIFDLLLRRQQPETRKAIIENVNKKINRNPDAKTHFFSVIYNLEFLHYELVNYRELPDEEINQDQDLRLFKAYFLIVEKVNESIRNTLRETPVYDADYFAKTTWPSFIDQFEINSEIYPFPIMLRGAVLLNYLKYHSPYAVYVDNYLKKHGKATALNYVLDIYNLLILGYKKFKNKSPDQWASCSFAPSDGFETIFEQFDLNIKDYQAAFSAGKSNYTGIRSKPLLKLEDGSHLVLSWPFLISKMYDGLVFDFYQYSGINEDTKFRTFLDFKKHIGGEVTEKYLFQKLLGACFKNKHQVLKFDDLDIKGHPDAYYRQGNNVMLIEIKDAYFPAPAIGSYSYEAITEAIDLKFNSSKKGTGQIIKQLQYLSQQPFENPPAYKNTKNLTIYPVLVYSDLVFGMPGINDYLDRAFKKQLAASGLRRHFKTIMPITMINITFLIQKFDAFDHKQYSLMELISQFHAHANSKRKKADLTREINDHIDSQPTFEDFALKKIPLREDGENYLTSCIKTFNLTKGLP